MTKTIPITDNFVEFKDIKTYYKRKINEFSDTVEEIMNLVEYKKDQFFDDDDDDFDYSQIEAHIAINKEGNLMEKLILTDNNSESETGINARIKFDISKLLNQIIDKESRKKINSLFDTEFWERSNSIMELYEVNELYVSSTSSYSPKSPPTMDFFYHFRFDEENFHAYSSFMIDFPISPEEKKLTINELLIKKKGLLLSPILSEIIDFVSIHNMMD
jgi:hypothetical protein